MARVYNLPPRELRRLSLREIHRFLADYRALLAARRSDAGG